MANPLAGLTGLGTLEVRRTIPEIAAVGVHLGAEAIGVGRAVGQEVEPIYGIPVQRYLDAYAGPRPDRPARRHRVSGESATGRPAEPSPGRGEGSPDRDRLSERLRLPGGRPRRVKTPFNDAVVAAVRALGVGFKPDPAHLDPVIRMLPDSVPRARRAT